ncbi:ribosome assembly RNA-binding protein YhbY [Fonticella tunisiensis]|uniref:RNA-binding protein n=1 Tax=Fonticella tunisiensis TaxID=1096341 RepID=A0A4R7KR97_9CLOT|nr:ribosome assembly RNA-binding protein YhbY [Fonticella tunisiensis]TDT61214.1 RNA-binding protein [Fonticella tunisiensis]
MLTGKQRSYLRALGNNINPVLQIGKNGIDEAFLRQVDETLEARELIKLTVLKNSLLSARECCDEICEALNAEPVQVIGNKFVIYRRAKEKPKIELPVYQKK